MAQWIECESHGTVQPRTIYVNLDQVVSLSGDDQSTVVRYAGGNAAEFVVAGSAADLLRRDAKPDSFKSSAG